MESYNFYMFAFMILMPSLFVTRLLISMIFNEFQNKNVYPSVRFITIVGLLLSLFIFNFSEYVVQNLFGILVGYYICRIIADTRYAIIILNYISHIAGAILGLTLYRIGFR